jgi:hypothetical protein
MAQVEVPHVSPSQSLHHSGQSLIVLGRQEQVNVVAHQHISVHLHAMLLGLLGQHQKHELAVGHAHENILAVVAAQDHVVWVTAQGESRESGHANSLIGI